MLKATTVSSHHELIQILELQKKNLKQNLSAEEKSSQGFVTMQFTIEMLDKLHQLAPTIIIKDENRVIAYANTLLLEGRSVYPDLEPMFINFGKLKWKDKPLYDYRFYTMGQICVDKEYRGKGLFEELYRGHKETYGSDFDFIITEISTSNHRSLRAHEKVGFETIHQYIDEMDEWAVVVWDWK